MSDIQTITPGFDELGLSEPVLRGLDEIGYESPSSIQAQTIPPILEGRDLVGQAQTGTGKTGAFALPILSRIDLRQTEPQVLVLVPTRELAIQVAEAFQRYASRLKDFHVLPIYGGSGYGGQLRQLKRGTHVIVATPGRLSDHLRRRTLDLSKLKCLVLDEADEMLRMGFLDEVEWILEQTPPERQVLLFSATMSEPIRRIAKRHLKNPVEITIKSKTSTAATINQRYWMVSGVHKLDALTRILEGEDFDAMLVFVRTKSATLDLVSRLEARGFAAAALNGDIAQNLREQTVDRLRNGELDILVATDVAARGLDVQRITHVINYDIPHDTESYIHRTGRTGRAGRTGEAILFVAPRERRLLLSIERATNQKIELMQLPSIHSINDARIAKFKQRIADTLAVEDLGFYMQIVEELRQEHNIPAIEIASALAKLLQGETPFLLDKNAPAPEPASNYGNKFDKYDRAPREGRTRREPRSKDPSEVEGVEEGKERYRLEVGYNQGVKPAAIVGAIANESGLSGSHIGRIEIYDDHSTVDLPEGMPADVFALLKNTRVAGKPLRISLDANAPAGSFKAKPKGKGKLDKDGKKGPKKFKKANFD
ncbi:MAG: DEAD/DEAH box helicase [Sumerlaeia bacterium]